MTLPRITEATIRQQASAETYRRGWDYERDGAVGSLVLRGQALRAEVEGSDPEPYRVKVLFDQGGVASASCTCPYDWGGWCKHVVAVLLATIHRPEAIEERPALDSLLAGLDRDRLVALLLRLAALQPSLADAIEVELASTATTAPAAPATAAELPGQYTPVDTGPIRRRVRGIFRGLDHMTGTGAYYAVSGIIQQMGQILDEAWSFIRVGDGRNACSVLEAITDEYTQLWERLDDSDGEAGEFFSEIGAAWTEALLSADVGAQERSAWVDKLRAWESDVVDYGVEDAFNAPLEAAEQGWDDPVLQQVLRGEGAPERFGLRDPEGLYEDLGDPLTNARLNVLERQGRFEEFLHLARFEPRAERYGTMLVRLGRLAEAVAYGRTSLSTSDQALALATALRERGEVDGAIEIAEHGLSLDGWKVRLATWLRDLATELGRADLALAAAGAAFREQPDLSTYLPIEALAGERWADRRAELLDFLRTQNPMVLHGKVEILLHEGLIDDAIAAVNAGAGAGHELVERVVDAALEPRPDWAIDACRHQAEWIMDGGKSQYYGAAARWLSKARNAYLATGRGMEWRLYRDELLARHGRKHSLVPLIKALG